MAKTRITIDPITRLEGHARIEIFLNDGKARDVSCHLYKRAHPMDVKAASAQ